MEQQKLGFIQQTNNVRKLKNVINEKGLRVKFKLAYLLYDTLFDEWNQAFLSPEQPFRVKRERLMKLSPIGNTKTYRACITDLVCLGLIEYKYGGKTPAIFVIKRVDFNDKDEAEKVLKEVFFEKALLYIDTKSKSNEKTAEEHESTATDNTQNTVITQKTQQNGKKEGENTAKTGQKQNENKGNMPHTQQKHEQNTTKTQPKTVNFAEVAVSLMVYNAINEGRKATGLDTLAKSNERYDLAFCEKIALFFSEKYPKDTNTHINSTFLAYAKTATDYEKVRYTPKWISGEGRLQEIHDKVKLTAKTVILTTEKKQQRLISPLEIDDIHRRIQSIVEFAFEQKQNLESKDTVMPILIEIAKLGTYQDFEDFTAQLVNNAATEQKQCFNTQNAYNAYQKWKIL